MRTCGSGLRNVRSAIRGCEHQLSGSHLRGLNLHCGWYWEILSVLVWWRPPLEFGKGMTRCTKQEQKINRARSKIHLLVSWWVSVFVFLLLWGAGSNGTSMWCSQTEAEKSRTAEIFCLWCVWEFARYDRLEGVYRQGCFFSWLWFFSWRSKEGGGEVTGFGWLKRERGL